jgi:hypothetical protein
MVDEARPDLSIAGVTKAFLRGFRKNAGGKKKKENGGELLRHI